MVQFSGEPLALGLWQEEATLVCHDLPSPRGLSCSSQPVPSAEIAAQMGSVRSDRAGTLAWSSSIQQARTPRPPAYEPWGRRWLRATGSRKRGAYAAQEASPEERQAGDGARVNRTALCMGRGSRSLQPALPVTLNAAAQPVVPAPRRWPLLCLQPRELGLRVSASD